MFLIYLAKFKSQASYFNPMVLNALTALIASDAPEKKLVLSTLKPVCDRSGVKVTIN
jgi:hypothetical protein